MITDEGRFVFFENEQTLFNLYLILKSRLEEGKMWTIKGNYIAWLNVNL